jgi:hypothetical protein
VEGHIGHIFGLAVSAFAEDVARRLAPPEDVTGLNIIDIVGSDMGDSAT